MKLFDFGMAEQIRSARNTDDGLEGLAGTLRYMSPECYQKKKYGTPSDVYSFGLLLWEIMTLENPFEKYFSDQLASQKTNGARPKLSRRCGSPSIQALIGRCWDQDPANRPAFSDIVRDIDVAISTSDSNEETDGYTPVYSLLSTFNGKNDSRTYWPTWCCLAAAAI